MFFEISDKKKQYHESFLCRDSSMHFILCISMISFIVKERKKERESWSFCSPVEQMKSVSNVKTLSILHRSSCYDTLWAFIDFDSFFFSWKKRLSLVRAFEWNEVTCLKKRWSINLSSSKDDCRHNHIKRDKCLTLDLSALWSKTFRCHRFH